MEPNLFLNDWLSSRKKVFILKSTFRSFYFRIWKGEFQFLLVPQNDLADFVLVSLLLTLRSDFIFFGCFHWLWTSENGLGEFVNLVYQKFIGGWGCGHFSQKTVGKWASYPWDSYLYVRAKVVVSYVILPGANDIKTCFLYIN